jgi:aspartate/glutamate racemase
MRLATELWAETRRAGRITAPEPALDGDVILAAQALSLVRSGVDVIVATTNTRHLSWFVDAREWVDVAL